MLRRFGPGSRENGCRMPGRKLRTPGNGQLISAKNLSRAGRADVPATSIHMLRLSLIWLLVAFTSGSLLLLNKAMGFHPALWALLLVHMEAAIFGWILQFVMATAYWMFPRL